MIVLPPVHSGYWIFFPSSLFLSFLFLAHFSLKFCFSSFILFLKFLRSAQRSLISQLPFSYFCIHTFIHPNINICMYVCMNLCMYTHTHVHKHIHIYIYYTYICIYAYISAFFCIYAEIYAYMLKIRCLKSGKSAKCMENLFVHTWLLQFMACKQSRGKCLASGIKPNIPNGMTSLWSMLCWSRSISCLPAWWKTSKTQLAAEIKHFTNAC